MYLEDLRKTGQEPYFSSHLDPCFFLKAVAGKFPKSIWQMPVDQNPAYFTYVVIFLLFEGLA